MAERKKRGAIIGWGYVGKAVENLLMNHYDLVIYDPLFDSKDGSRKMRDSINSYQYKSVYTFDKDKVNDCDFAIVCVPTPQRDDGLCDTEILEDTMEWLKTPLVLIKSTTPPKQLEQIINKRKGACFSPEYIGEGKYFVPYWRYPHPTDMRYHDFMIIGGEREDTQRFVDLFLPILGPSCRFFQTDVKTAALAKYMENCWGAMKVTFCNEWYRIADACGVDYRELRELFLLDGRTERMHTAVFPDKPGYSGKCYPKDVKAIIGFSNEAGYKPELVEEVDKSNNRFQRKECGNPCRDYIFGGCGNKNCGPKCHQPKEFYEK